MCPARPLVIAHRGASGYRPENTLSAYALAVEQGADMIEIDLHRTRDGEIVVTHDEHLTGLGGRGEIADASFAEVRALDAGAGQRVPTLDEVLEGFGARIPFNLELKQSTRGPYLGLEAETLKRIEPQGLLGAMLFSSFFDPVLAELRGRSPEARIGVLVVVPGAGGLDHARAAVPRGSRAFLGRARDRRDRGGRPRRGSRRARLHGGRARGDAAPARARRRRDLHQLPRPPPRAAEVGHSSYPV